MNRRSWKLVSLPVALALLATVAALPAAAHAAKPGNVKVETRNVYLGTDIPGRFPIVLFGTPEESRAEAGTLYRIMQDTNFIARAEPLAAEIETTRPDLIGLQEVALWRRGPLADQPSGPVSEPSAAEPVYDFLRLFRGELKRRGLGYRVGVQQDEFDVEFPTDLGFDVRLTMRDVILYRRAKRVKVFKPRSANFQTQLEVGGAVFTRGWTSVEARVRGNRFRFVNTHLESVGAGIATGQAGELVEGPLNARRQVILVGDLNSDPAAPPPDSDGYNAIVDAGFVDRGTSAQTCCFSEDLLGDGFSSRIDHVLTRPAMKRRRNALLGVDPTQRTGLGMWPSDHAGVIAVLR